MKRAVAIITIISMLAIMFAVLASATAPAYENGIYYSESVTRAESTFDMQSANPCAYFCANGIPIVISERTDGVAGSLITWEYEGATYTKSLPARAIVSGGGWDTSVASTSVTMTGGIVNYGLFGGGIKEGADVGTPDAPGTISIVITGGEFHDGIVGGGMRGDVYGDITVTVGGDSLIAENVIGGGFYGDVVGDIDCRLEGGGFGLSVTQTFICGAGVFGDVTGTIDLVVDGANVNGSVAGGSMIGGNVNGPVNVSIESGEIMDLVGGGIGYFSMGTCTVTGDINVTVNGGVVEDIVCGGGMGDDCGVIGNTTVTINDGAIGGTGGGHTRNVLGGSLAGDVEGNATVIINGGTMENQVVGGGYEGSVSGNTQVIINNGTIGENVVGGSLVGDVGGSIDIIIVDGTVTEGIVGGSVEGSVSGDTTIALDGGTVTGGVIGGCGTGNVQSVSIAVRGGTVDGGIMAGAVTGNVSGAAEVVISGGVVTGDVIGGANEGNIGGNVSVGVTGNAVVTGNVIIGSITSGTIATNEDAEIVVAVDKTAVEGEVTATENVPAEVFNPTEDVIDASEPVWGEWTVTIDPTCYSYGEETRYDTVLGSTKSETREVAMLPHNFSTTNGTIHSAANCYLVGTMYYYCTNPGCTAHEEVAIPTTEHVMGDWIIVSSPSFINGGLMVRHCTELGCEYSEESAIEATGFSSLMDFINELLNSLKELFANITAMFK